MTTAHRVTHAAAWTIGSRAVRLVLAVAASAVVVRALGPHDYGVLSLVRTVLLFVVLLATAGMSQTVLRLAPPLRVAGDGAAARRLLRRVFAGTLVVWAVATAVALAGRGLADRAFHVPGAGGLIALAVSLAVFEAAFTVVSPFLYAAYDARRQSVAAVAGHAAYLAALGLVVARGATVAAVVAATAFGFAVATAIAARGFPPRWADARRPRARRARRRRAMVPSTTREATTRMPPRAMRRRTKGRARRPKRPGPARGIHATSAGGGSCATPDP